MTARPRPATRSAADRQAAVDILTLPITLAAMLAVKILSPGPALFWQVTSRGEAGVEAQQAHDTYYIRNWSVWLDLHILAQTFHAVLSGRGAY